MTRTIQIYGVALALSVSCFVSTAPMAQAQDSFPSSSEKLSGKPWKWKVMSENGYTGSLREACDPLGLSQAECAGFERARSMGECRVMTLPANSGIVLDAMVFTKEGKRTVQEGILVALEKYPSLQTEVCDLGGGVYGLRFHGCNNYAVVRTSPPPVKATRCVPLPKERAWNVVFPSKKDFQAWKACNPQARCSEECENWLINGGGHREGDFYSGRIRAVTGQHQGKVYALKDPTMRPRELAGDAVLCEQDPKIWNMSTNKYWNMSPKGDIRSGIGD